MYERRAQPPISPAAFLRRLVRHAGYGGTIVLVSLAAGTAGFHWFVGLGAVDALLDAAMLLGGMGPVGDLTRASVGGKLFAAGFALYAGLVFLIVAGVLVTPVLHRVLHVFHWDAARAKS